MRLPLFALIALGVEAREAAALWGAVVPPVSAQAVCRAPDSIRSRIPPDIAGGGSGAPLPVVGDEGASVALGIGHLHPTAQDLPPGPPGSGGDRIRLLELPLSAMPGSPATAWLAGGWILRAGAPPEPFTGNAMIETGYEEVSFIVLEASAGGWVKIRYARGAGDRGTAWTRACSPDSPIPLEFDRWSTWFTNGVSSPLLLRSAEAGSLHESPNRDARRLDDIAADHSLEPLEIRGEWMRVRVREPSDYCAIDRVSSTREGWVRWYAPDRGPLVWYFTRGC